MTEQFKFDEKHLEKITKNYEKFVSFCTTLGDRTAAVNELIEHLGERLVTCSASSRVDYHNAWPGGLVDHSLRVLTCAIKIAKSMEVNVSKESLVLSCLFHDIGKVGSLTADAYLPETSAWHKERGRVYTPNYDIQYMTSAHRGLFLLQHFDVKLTEDEFMAILLNDGPEADENRVYSMKEPTLAVIVHMADRMACEIEKLDAQKKLESEKESGQ